MLVSKSLKLGIAALAAMTVMACSGNSGSRDPQTADLSAAATAHVVDMTILAENGDVASESHLGAVYNEFPALSAYVYELKAVTRLVETAEGSFN
jgi:hypothetical protein